MRLFSAVAHFLPDYLSHHVGQGDAGLSAMLGLQLRQCGDFMGALGHDLLAEAPTYRIAARAASARKPERVEPWALA